MKPEGSTRKAKRRIRIGFDAKWFYAGHPSGKRFTAQLVEHLARYHPEHDYEFILRFGDRAIDFPFKGENLSLRFLSFGTNLTTNVLLMPFVLKASKLDVLVNQNFAAPFVKCPQIVVVFDAIFRSDPQFFTLRERLYFSMLKPLLRLADAVITISEYSRKELIKFGYIQARQSCHVLHLGVDNKFLEGHHSTIREIQSFKTKYKLPERFVLYVGRLNQRKNLDNLIRGMSHIDGKGTDLVICGQRNWKMDGIAKVAKEAGISHRIRTLETIDDDELPLLYRSATIFAFVSHREGFGLPPLEAMACGVPVVVSNSSSLPEVCGDAAVYVDATNPQDIGRGLEKLLVSSELRLNMTARGLERVREFTWPRVTERFLEILTEVIGHKV